MILLFLGCTDIYRDLGIILDASGSMCIDDKGRKGAIRLLEQIAPVANFSLNGSHGAFVTFIDDPDDQRAHIQFNDNVTVDEFIEKSVDECMKKQDDEDRYVCACRGGTDIIAGLNFSLTNIFNTASGMRKNTSKIAVLITDGRDYNTNDTYKNMGIEYEERDITLLVLGVGTILDERNLKLLVQSPSFFFKANDWDQLDADFVNKIIAVLCKGNELFL